MNALASPILTLPQVAQLAGGDLVVRELPAGPSAREAWLRSGIGGASIDTRTLEAGDLFVPLRGARADGHRFLAEAFARGAAAALCERSAYPSWEGREPGPLVLVDDATTALQRIARRHRESWHGLLIGVTGSAGKTTTKDLVTAVLATAGPVLGTEGNLNNHWGVPLTLLRIRPEHRAAVIEMAMNAAGEIAALAAIAEPNAAVITNAGSAHLGGRGLGTLESIAAEKAALGFALPPGAPLLACADSPRLITALHGVKARLVRYGFARTADLHPERVEDLGENGTRLHVSGFPPVTLAIPGRHQALNALAALAAAREWHVDPGAAAGAIAAYRPGRGRMQVRHARGATLLVDHYNANPDSVRAALETLAGLPARRRIAVLGDMLELGPESARLHRETGATARDAELWLVGVHAADWAAGARTAGVTTRVFADKAALAEALAAELGPDVAVLVKGSRGAALEDVLTAVGVEV
ncbi:MAG TPA: UDP-N-acetylmuramoyl-tripeptide--D-alanyl-D-alanine ligase [Dongiaceae bacterium]|nr:UDP-N-acetylmuramoyl-tripeptide--D-alanyl-D-alanine ligase [Dongiaceae bacterium]